MSLKFISKVEPGDLAHYKFIHKYKSISGILELIIGVVLLVAGIMYFVQADANGKVYPMLVIFFGFYFLVLCPLNIIIHTNMHFKMNPMLSMPLEYELTDEGITVSEKKEASETDNENEADSEACDEDKAKLLWSEVVKVLDNGRSIVIYISKYNANIIPKDKCDGDIEAIKAVFRDKLPKEKVKKL